MRKNIILTPIVMILAAGAAMSAQDTTGALAGRVTGPDGRGLKGVHVQITSPSLLGPRQAVTDDNGQFRSQLLPGGQYTIVYTLSGYLTRSLRTTVLASQTIRADAQLRPIDAAAAEVEIVAESQQQVDKTDTIVQSVYSNEKLQLLFGDFGHGSLNALVPGVDNLNNFQPKVRGGTQGGIKFLVDGSNVTNMAENTSYGATFPNSDAIESIAVIQSPLNARYGNTDNGIISYVLSKGSNEFTGSLRANINREEYDYWAAIPGGRPNNRGEDTYGFWVGDDKLEKSYQFYLSGPLWKDHVTFTWSANVTPREKEMSYITSSVSNVWMSTFGQPPDYRDRVGTYYQNPSTGEIIRNAELLEAEDRYNRWPREFQEKNDTFTLYWQISPSHQLEYSHFQYSELSVNPSNFRLADMSTNKLLDYGGYGGQQRRWTMAYKGIIGQSGVLEARMGYFYQAWANVYEDKGPKYAVSVHTMPSYYPINPNGDLLDPNNYLASGFIDANLPRLDAIKDSTLGGYSNYHFNANNQGAGDTATNDTMAVNYQHFLDTRMGQHIIDVGFQRDKSGWANPNLYNADVNADRLILVPGRIDLNLSQSDVLGYAGTPLSDYQGKFIVYNMDYATFGSIDPYGFSRFNRGTVTNEPTDINMRLLDWQNGAGYLSGYWPTMSEQFGLKSSHVFVQTTSLYANDLWSINDYHSVMAGVRFDQFKTWNKATGKDIYSYSQPTFRFEYKWDVTGDQKRVFNVSWGQFHNMPGVSTFSGLIDGGVQTWLWDGGARKGGPARPLDRADGRPYLVGFSDIMDINNYGLLRSDTYSDVNEIAPGFKLPISTELTVGLRLNLDNGGSIRASYVSRSWANLFSYVYNGWKPNREGNLAYSRLLKNHDFYERSYNSFELEWSVPVTRRAEFGGSWTFARLMRNDSATGNESNSQQKTSIKNVDYFEEYNQFDYPHYGWMPTKLDDSEQRYKAYLNYDLGYGNVRSNLTFRFQYTTGGPGNRSYNYRMGYPIVEGINEHHSGVGMVPGAQLTNAGLYDNRTVLYNINRTGMDSWGTTLQYNLEVPMVQKLRWFVNWTISNPFNHIGKGGTWYAIDGWVPGSLSVVPETIYRPDDTVYVQQNRPYDVSGMYSDNVQRTNANLFAPNQRQGGRGFAYGVATGLRF